MSEKENPSAGGAPSESPVADRAPPPEDFAAALRAWFAAHKRALPFRQNADAYHIWLSEILGQQTRMTALLPYYERFSARFPRLEVLAAAEEGEVLALWAGLGYYARARNLHRAARLIVEEKGGLFPRDYAEIRALPGVGDYTAGAICSIAYGQKTPAIDGNVRRVYARLCAGEGDAAPWLRLLMDYAPPAVVTEGMMELGALVCLPAAPRCGICPVSVHCRARKEDKVSLYPAKAPKAPKREERLRCCLVRNSLGEVLLRRRRERLLHRMWEFPSAESLQALEPDCVVAEKVLARHRHVFTHIVWHMSFHRAELPKTAKELPEDFVWFAPEALPALPSAMKPFALALTNATSDTL